MSRVARIVVPGFAHHVTQRGNRRADVFYSDDDRRAYLRFLRQYTDRHGLAVWAYCLMTNHVHIVVVPQREDSLAKALRDTHTVYAMRFNTATQQSGHVWQGRFYSCPLDETHLWAAVRYVERNPVRAGLVSHAADYRWSSAPAHCGNAADGVLSKEFPPRGVVNDWADWLRTEDEEYVARIRSTTRTGRPCGGKQFLVQLESLLGRVLHPKKRGRKAKTPTGYEALEGESTKGLNS
jgi:putative transposase